MENTNTAPEEENFAEMFEASIAEHADLTKGELTKCMVVAVGDQDVIVDVGAKNECAISLSEFETLGENVPKVGDEIEVMVLSAGGNVRLSVLEGRRRQIWLDVETALETGTTLWATVMSEVKGGFRVDLKGLGAFMPRSEADVSTHVSMEQLEGESFEVTVLECNQRQNNVVVSRRRPLEAVQDEKRKAFFATHQVGDRVSGKVKRLADFGSFVDLGGIDALLHISDLAWRRIEHPSEMLSVGQVVHAEIIKLNEETGKVSISMKSLQEDPWSNASAIYETGMRLTGTVRKLLDFGAVIELEPGVEGLIHRSEMSWTRKDIKPIDILAEGDVVDVTVIEIDGEQRRIRLSLKEVMENPWESWLVEHPVGSKITGKIRNIKDFGFFVKLTEELDGLVHIGNLSWQESGDDVIQNYQKGQDIEALVLGVDVAKQRISLGIKQLEDDPFDVFLAGVQRGSAVKGKVMSVQSGAVMVEVAEGVLARLAKRELPRDMAELKEGDEIEAKIIDVNKKRRQVDLSIRQLLHDEERDAVRQYATQLQEEETPSALALELQRKLLGK